LGAVVAYLCVLASEQMIGTGRSAAALALVTGSVLGGGLYLMVARAMDLTELREILDSVRGR
jgi:hypothetical protein